MYLRTRTRKTKLIPRTEEHISSEETHDVQKPSTSDGRHKSKSPFETLPGQFDVRIKVEMCDEESENIKFFKPRKKLRTSKSSNKQISQYLLDNNEITEKIDYEFSYSLPLAERLLLIAIRNNLGNSLKCPPREPEDIKMDDVYKACAKWYEKDKEHLCIIYKCYICKESWFHLYNFRSHLKTHDIDVITVALETFVNTCHVVAYHGEQPDPCLFESDEICPVCNKEVSIHNKNVKCPFCKGYFYNCYTFKLHESTCSYYIKCLKRLPKETAMSNFIEFTCNICMLPFFSPQQIYDHMSLSHSVRSDYLCPWEHIKDCTFCSDKYVQFSHHACLARTENLPLLNCNRRFHNGYVYQLHYSMCTRHFPCRVCKKLLLTECTEKEHLLTHTNNFVNVYKCSLCPNNLLCIDQYSYIKHIEIWHMKTKWKTKITKTDMLAVPKSWVKDAVHYQYDAYTDALKLSHTKAVEENENTTETTEPNEPNDQPDLNENDASDLRNLEKAPVVGVEQEIIEQSKKAVEPEAIESNIEKAVEIKKECEDIDDVNSQVDEGLIINIKTENEEHHIYVECNSINNENDPIKMEYTYNTLMYAAGFANKNNEENTSEENSIILNNTEIFNNIVVNNSVNSDNMGTWTQKEMSPIPEIIDASNNRNTINMELDNLITFDNDNNEESDKQRECDGSSPTTKIEINNGMVIKTEPIDDDDMGELLNIDTESESSDISVSEAVDVKTQTSISTLNRIVVCKNCNFSHEHDGYVKHILQCTSRSKKLKPTLNQDIIIKSEPVDSIGDVINMDSNSDQDDAVKEIFVTADFHEIYKCKKCNFTGGNHVCPIKISKESKRSSKNKNGVVTKHIIKDELIIKTDISDGEGEFAEAESGVANTVDAADAKRKASYPGKIYKCKKCEFTGSDNEYSEHALIHDEVPPGTGMFPCSKCSKHYPTLAKYAKHLKLHKYVYLQCPVCDLQFVAMHEFALHLNSHIKKTFLRIHRIDISSMDCGEVPKSFLCKLCRSDVLPENFFKHWEHHMHIKPNKTKEVATKSSGLNNMTMINKLISQPITDEKLVQDALKYLQAERERMGNKKKIRTCCICLRIFVRVNDCKRHLIEHLLSHAYMSLDIHEGLKCQICSETFPKVEGYKQHMREHGGLPIYKCTLCSKAFSDSSNFTKHKKVHNLTPYTCDTCGKKFQAKFTMEKHVMSHMLSTPLKCVECDRLFYTESAIKKHRRIVHDKIKPVIQCHICRKIFTSFREKWDHLWNVHKLRKTEADCPFCPKSYRRFLDLKRHCFDVHGVTMRNTDIKKKVNGEYELLDSEK